MATYITPDLVAEMAPILLENELVAGNLVYRDIAKEFAEPTGGTVRFKKPVNYRASQGPVMQETEPIETEDSISCDQSYHVAIPRSVIDNTLSVKDFATMHLKPAMSALANQIDQSIYGLYTDVYNCVGTAGTAPNATATIFAAMRRAMEEAWPDGDRSILFNPAAMASMAEVISGKYQPEMVRAALRDAALGRLGGFDIFGAQNVKSHATGTHDANYVLDGAAVEGSVITVKTGTGTLVKGDTLTIAGMYAVNPKTGASTGVLKDFTVTANYSGGGGNISISPAIILTGANQTVSALGIDGAAVTIRAAHAANLAFHKNAFALVVAPLKIPQSAGKASRASYKGISILVTEDFDQKNLREVIRLDVLYGVKTMYNNLACRIMG